MSEQFAGQVETMPFSARRAAGVLLLNSKLTATLPPKGKCSMRWPAVRLATIVTRYFWRTMVAVVAACFFAYLPALVTCLESLLQGSMNWWPAFGTSIEPALGGAIAISVAGCLTYYENELEFRLGRICGLFAFMSFVGTLFLLVAFYVAHNPANGVRGLTSNGGSFAQALLSTLIAVTLFSVLTILQVRRKRDGYLYSKGAANA